jgi:hypothetical protein
MLYLCALTTLLTTFWNIELLSTDFQTARYHNQNTKDFDIMQQWREKGRNLAMRRERRRRSNLVGVCWVRWYINKLQDK